MATVWAIDTGPHAPVNIENGKIFDKDRLIPEHWLPAHVFVLLISTQISITNTHIHTYSTLQTFSNFAISVHKVAILRI